MNNNYKITIPPMTHPLGKHWPQPAASKILITDTRAIMTRETFNKLADYSASIPTGVYEGKMWKAKTIGGTWLLRWYDNHPTIKNRCSIKHVAIFVNDN